MVYVRNGNRANLDALRVRQQIAAAELEKAERELAAIEELERDLIRLQQRKEQINQRLKQAHSRTSTKRVQLALPPVVHGGREGLLRAAEEAKEWDKKRRGSKNGEGHPPVLHTHQ